jgi:diadenosine tetraphosphate (Ap4A) HIT family hydrolase
MSPTCPFCAIASHTPPSSDPAIIHSPHGSAYPLLSTPKVLAFLDIAPLSPGHTLLIPRRHYSKAAEMSGAEAAVLGFWLPVLTRAIMKAVGTGIEEGSWNVLQANGNLTSFLVCLKYFDGSDVEFRIGTEAGQTVPHSHFHIIPRLATGEAHEVGEITDAERKNLVLGEGPRALLKREEGIDLVGRIKEVLKEEVKILRHKGEIEDVGSVGDWVLKAGEDRLQL